MGIRGIILFLTVAFILLCVYTSYSASMVYVKASNGKEYLVRSVKRKQQAAELLSQVDAAISKLIAYVNDNRETQTEFCQTAIARLAAGFDPSKTSEAPDSSSATSYTINKKRIFLCLRDKTTDEFVDINTLVYTMIHEVAHVMSYDVVDHPDAFWTAMSYLLRSAIDCGVYTYVDYAKTPVNFCGIKISSTPLKTPTGKPLQCR
jgi:hypothetical protein